MDSIQKTARASIPTSRPSNKIGIEAMHSPDSAFDLIEECFLGDQPHANKGGRALDAVIRPYAAKIAGTPLSMLFVLEKCGFEFVFITPKSSASGDMRSKIGNTTEIFLPEFHYGTCMQPEVIVSDGLWEFEPSKQTISWIIDPTAESPTPKSPGAPIWFAAQPSLASTSLLETHNFHTIQIFACQKACCKSRNSVFLKQTNFNCNIL